ncbi:uncharacterized protein MYCFIDRAFT_209393 [Pseudocercospora fijiensis CIRAD86]|uniref:Uncharacterized protein n=1 Tax=Pseudocercospora fijiensis (strain CIRAD86) TaxID=383855 RepID=M2ZCQ9_PSEFD|nr:uncharacterized protein MYCFIDRAFT_209393 [Pseudocercospora fijiensis CIRAD86]EME76899.1 hypothetical protein MYCFIDRAFT_209393 [Pseudocercospora fijiensis CIRAD86]
MIKNMLGPGTASQALQSSAYRGIAAAASAGQAPVSCDVSGAGLQKWCTPPGRRNNTSSLIFIRKISLCQSSSGGGTTLDSPFLPEYNGDTVRYGRSTIPTASRNPMRFILGGRRFQRHSTLYLRLSRALIRSNRDMRKPRNLLKAAASVEDGLADNWLPRYSQVTNAAPSRDPVAVVPMLKLRQRLSL